MLAQIVNTTLIYEADLRHIPAGIIGEHQGAISRLGSIAEGKPAFTLFLHGGPVFSLYQLFDELLHSGLEDVFDPFAFQDHPVLVEPGQEFTLIYRKTRSKRLEIRIRSFQ